MDLEWTEGEAVSYDAEQALPGRYFGFTEERKCAGQGAAGRGIRDG